MLQVRVHYPPDIAARRGPSIEHRRGQPQPPRAPQHAHGDFVGERFHPFCRPVRARVIHHNEFEILARAAQCRRRAPKSFLDDRRLVVRRNDDRNHVERLGARCWGLGDRKP